ncbi:MAG: DUF255 domain-containing protein [Bacteroidales bacterium]
MKSGLKYFCFILAGFATTMFSVKAQVARGIQWMSFEEAVKRNEGYPKKKIFIDVYTDWCGWCKKMDAETFADSTVAAYMSRIFWCVKLNAERQDTVEYAGRKWTSTQPGQPRAPHQLAAALLQGRMSYPSYVILDENNNKITSLAGYQQASQFILVLRYFGENLHFQLPWEEFRKQQEQKKP